MEVRTKPVPSTGAYAQTTIYGAGQSIPLEIGGTRLLLAATSLLPPPH